MRAHWSLMLSLCVLGGCTSFLSVQSIHPNTSNKADLRRELGKPTDVRFAANGDEIWEYARGPMGRQTFIARIGRDGLVHSFEQVLSEKFYDRVIPYRTVQPEVRALLGRPSDIQIYTLSGAEVWMYPIRDEALREAKLTVTFNDEGIVTQVGKLLEIPGAAQVSGTGSRK